MAYLSMRFFYIQKAEAYVCEVLYSVPYSEGHCHYLHDTSHISHTFRLWKELQLNINQLGHLDGYSALV